MAGAVAVAVLVCVWGATKAPAGGVYRLPGTALQAGTAPDPTRGPAAAAIPHLAGAPERLGGVAPRP